MDNPQDALSALLSDPAALSAAMEMAKSFLGGGGKAAGAPSPVPSQAPSEAASPPQDGGKEPAVGTLQNLLAPIAASGEDDKAKLLLALKPFLSPKRSEKVGTVLALMRAMQMMGAASLFDFGKGS